MDDEQDVLDRMSLYDQAFVIYMWAYAVGIILAMVQKAIEEQFPDQD